MKQQTMIEELLPFLSQFELEIPKSVADEGHTLKTDVVQETTDDD